MNKDFKRAVLEKAYEDLKKAEPWDEESLYLEALLDHDLVSGDKADAFLLARALYAKNLERMLWEEIQEIIIKEKEKHPDYFPEPEYLSADVEENYVYESDESSDGLAADAAEAPKNSVSEQAVPTGSAAPDENGMEGLNQDAEPPFNTAEYNVIDENPFKSVSSSPLSTFSIDVDTAGYTKLKYDILDGYEIEKDEVKIEEMINYFNYDYSGSRTGNEPFTISTEYTRCPWNEKHGLIRIGVLADDMQEKPATNFVIVVDVSGSMMLINKLPLALSAYADMLAGFDGKDTISLMYYASGQDVILKNVKCDKKEEIFKGLANVLGSAGGGTYGALGLQTAYEMAEKSYAENGVNRVLIATDGDFNIGETSEGDLKGIVEEGRKKGVYLTILGYGSENLKDNKMEVMAENGNGNYHYIGDMADARKALVQESSSTLIPMADDVKIQVEFNPAFVQDYRLIGYESRILNAEDFNNDKVDAGDVGAGKSVTALYEIVPTGEEGETDIPDLKYSRTEATGDSKDLCTVAVRYKDINSGKTGSGSRLVEKAVLADDYHETPDANTALAISLAEAGMVIRDSEFKGTATLTSAEAIARAAASESGNELASSWAELLHTLIEQSE
jgi:Ca-activated chloride channel family protein